MNPDRYYIRVNMPDPRYPGWRIIGYRVPAPCNMGLSEQTDYVLGPFPRPSLIERLIRWFK